MIDLRHKKLADNLVKYSVRAKKGDKVMVEAFGVENGLVKAIVNTVYEVGAYPFVVLRDHEILRATISGGDEEYFKKLAEYDGYIMADMDCYIGIRGGLNSYELSDVPSDKNDLYGKIYSYPVHHEKRVNGTRWVILRYPTPSMAQLAGMSTESFEDFFYDVCTLDYQKMENAMDALYDLMKRTDKVRIIAPGTDLSFSIKGIGANKCSGHRNIPDGEVYSAPVKDSVNGYITYNTPTVQGGVKYTNVHLEFENGKIVKATSDGGNPAVEKVFDIDEGARYVGEFSFGLNPFITKPIGDILFDEKIAGSIHFTPGCCYEACPNGNYSALHWDLVLMMTEDVGGGEIWFDGKLVRKNGVFVMPELFALNPENLK